MDDKEPSKYNALCDRMVDNLVKHVIIVLNLLFLSYFTIGMSSLYLIVFKHKHATILGTEIPYFESNTNLGFAVNIFEQFLLACLSVMANFTIEIGDCLINNTISTIPEIIHLESDDLETELKSNGMTSNATLQVRNILMRIQDFDG